MKKHLLSMAFIAGLLTANAELTIVHREPLGEQNFTLGHGETKTVVAKSGKKSWAPEPEGSLYGLRVRTFIKSTDYDGWTMLMRLKVNGRQLQRYNAKKQKRLINHSDEIKFKSQKYSEHLGEPWYSEYYKAWNVAYGVKFAPQQVFCPNFDYDVTEFIFDIDDLVVVDDPLTISITNITTERKGLLKLVETQKRAFPLVVGAFEIVKFKNPEERHSQQREIKPPTAAQTEAVRKRLLKVHDFAPERFEAECRNLAFAQRNFTDCNIHRQLDGNYHPGQIWLEYNSASLKAESFIPMLDEAQKNGVTIVKVHAWWASVDYYSPFRPSSPSAKKDFLKLIDICHKRNMKLVAYVSPGWTMVTDDYDKEWEFSDSISSSKKRGQWGRVCTGSIKWRTYFFKNVQKLFDDYPVDGVYVDYGIYPPLELSCTKPSHCHAFKNPKEPYASGHDMLMRLHALCQKNGKLLYLFAESKPGMHDVCDAQIVGESTESMSAHRLRHASLKGNVFFLHLPLRYTFYSLREVYGSTMVFGHFPVLCHYSKMFPGDAEWFYYFLTMWQEMMKPGTHIYREIKTSPFIKAIPPETAVSAFVNTSCYLVLSNFSSQKRTFTFKQPVMDLETGERKATVTVQPSDLNIVRICTQP